MKIYQAMRELDAIELDAVGGGAQTHPTLPEFPPAPSPTFPPVDDGSNG